MTDQKTQQQLLKSTGMDKVIVDIMNLWTKRRMSPVEITIDMVLDMGKIDIVSLTKIHSWTGGINDCGQVKVKSIDIHGNVETTSTDTLDNQVTFNTYLENTLIKHIAALTMKKEITLGNEVTNLNMHHFLNNLGLMDVILVVSNMFINDRSTGSFSFAKLNEVLDINLLDVSIHGTAAVYINTTIGKQHNSNSYLLKDLSPIKESNKRYVELALMKHLFTMFKTKHKLNEIVSAPKPIEKEIEMKYVPPGDAECRALHKYGFHDDTMCELMEWLSVKSKPESMTKCIKDAFEKAFIDSLTVDYNGKIGHLDSTVTVITEHTYTGEIMSTTFPFKEIAHHYVPVGRMPLMNFIAAVIEFHIISNHIKVSDIRFKEEYKAFFNEQLFTDERGSYVTLFNQHALGKQTPWIRFKGDLQASVDFAIDPVCVGDINFKTEKLYITK